MNALSSARMGLALGLACALPCAFWLAAASDPSDPASSAERLREGARALWILEAVALALALPRALGAGRRDRAAGGALLVLAPLPLLAALRLADAGATAAFGLGLVAAGAWLAAVIALAELVGRWLPGPESRRLGCAALEVCLAALALGSRHLWLAWTGL